jgi:hypothetical protein
MVAIRSRWLWCRAAFCGGLFLLSGGMHFQAQGVATLGNQAIQSLAKIGTKARLGYKFSAGKWEGQFPCLQNGKEVQWIEILKLGEVSDPSSGLIVHDSSASYIVAVDTQIGTVMTLGGFGARDLDGFNELIRLAFSRGCPIDRPALLKFYAEVEQGRWVSTEQECKQAFLSTGEEIYRCGSKEGETLWKMQDQAGLKTEFASSDRVEHQHGLIKMHVVFPRGLERVFLKEGANGAYSITKVEWAQDWRWEKLG